MAKAKQLKISLKQLDVLLAEKGLKVTPVEDAEDLGDDDIDQDALAEASARFCRGDVDEALIWLERALPRDKFPGLADRVARYFEITQVVVTED